MNDLISRQAAIRWVKTECNPYGKPTLEFESGKKVIEHLEQMPSAQPSAHQERMRGRWVPVTNGRGGYECDQCHNYAPSYQDGAEWLSDFCPNCGARMDEEVEGRKK